MKKPPDTRERCRGAGVDGNGLDRLMSDVAQTTEPTIDSVQSVVKSR